MQPRDCVNRLDTDIDQIIDRSGIDISILEGKSILVTGGTGFFGTWLLSALVEIKHRLNGSLELTVLSRNPERFCANEPGSSISKDVRFIAGDIKTFRDPTRQQITHVCHMATASASETFSGLDSVSKLDTLFKGTQNLLSQYAKGLECLLFTSSGAAYGATGHGELIRESDFGVLSTIDRGSGLALGKLASEYLIAAHAASEGFKFSIARCFSFAGPYLPLNLHYAFGNFVASALRKEVVHLKGDGTDQRSYMYIGDAIAWLLRLLVEPKNGIYNVGSERAIEIKRLAEVINTELDNPSQIEILNQQFEEGNFQRSVYLPCTDKIRDHYPGLKEWTSLEEIVRSMAITYPIDK
jgi:UDP-glucuronate decarboxylase